MKRADSSAVVAPDRDLIPAPSMPADITTGWLDGELRKAGFAGEGPLMAPAVSDLGPGKGTPGLLVRITFRYEQHPPAAPRSVIAKFPASPGPTRSLADEFRLYEREARFYQHLAPRAGVPTPRLYSASAIAATGDCVLLIEDLAPADEGNLMSGCSLNQAGALVDALAGMHAAWWDSPDLDQFGWLPQPNEESVLDLARRVATPAWRAYLARYGHLVSPDAREVARRAEHDLSVLHRLSASPRTLTHGDLRINNMMFAQDGRLVAVIDWQTAAKARGPMDIASLFVSSLTPDDRRIAETELLPRYHRALLELGVEGYSYEECWTDYRVSVVNQFSQQAAILHLIGLDISDDPTSDPMSAMAARLRAAVDDLDLANLLPPPPPMQRIRSFAGRIRARLA